MCQQFYLMMGMGHKWSMKQILLQDPLNNSYRASVILMQVVDLLIEKGREELEVRTRRLHVA